MKPDERSSDKYDAMLQQRIGQALREEYSGETLDPQILLSWAADEQRKKRQRRRKYALIASMLLVCICAAAAALHAGLLSGSSVSVAGKNGDRVSETGDGAVIKGNQADAGENLGSVKVTIRDWEKVYDAQKEHPDMLIPEYVPEGYVFEKLEIEENELKEKYSFYFIKEDKKLMIKQSEHAETVAIYEYNKVLKNMNKLIFVNSKENEIYYEQGDMFITIKGILEVEEIIKMANQLKESK